LSESLQGAKAGKQAGRRMGRRKPLQTGNGEHPNAFRSAST
jgi:hypothetical protein